jgi:predicted permease
VAQVTLSVVLLVGAGLFVRSMLSVRSLHLGYDVDPLLFVEPQLRSETPTVAELSSLKHRLLERAQSLPSVEAASLITTLPFYQSSSGPVFVPGVDTATINRHGEFTRQHGSVSYFATAGTRIVRGRGFTAADRQGTPRVAVVSEAMAKALWPVTDAIGRCMKLGIDTMPCTTVVGVSENVRLGTLNGDPSMHYYLPIEQRSPAAGRLLIRIRGDAGKHVEEIRRELQRLMPGTSYVTVTPFADIVGSQTRAWRLGATLFWLLGLLALVVAALGLYSVIAYDVAQRTHELGVRVALGAQSKDVLRLIVGEGVRVGVVGVAVGGTIALWAGRWIKPLLFDGAARDPWVFGAVVVTLLSVSVVASLLPATRATRTDPNSALRAE